MSMFRFVTRFAAIAAITMALWFGNGSVQAQEGFLVTQIGDNLIIAGDNGDDEIRIEPLMFRDYMVPDAFEVSFNWGWVGLGVGRSYEPQWQETFYGVENIAIDAGDGLNEIVLMHRCRIGGSLDIEAGDGDDSIRIYEGSFGGDVQINAGHGGNSINLSSSTIGGDFHCESGNGNDQFNFYHRYLEDVRVAGDVVIDLGNGNDIAQIIRFQCGRGLRIDMGGGTDHVTISSTHFSSRPAFVPTTVAGNCVIAHSGFGGIDAYVHDTEIDGSLFFLAKGGNDRLSIRSRTWYDYESPMFIGGNLFAFCGSGDDEIFASGLELNHGSLFARLDAGADAVQVHDSNLLSMDINLGSDKDTFTLQNSSISLSATIDGGSSNDIGNVLGTQASSLDAQNFEDGNLAK